MFDALPQHFSFEEKQFKIASNEVEENTLALVENHKSKWIISTLLMVIISQQCHNMHSKKTEHLNYKASFFQIQKLLTFEN